jgi:CubicO group peptidase (beta-lactamase class C family)
MLAHSFVALYLLGFAGPRPVAELDAAIDGFLRAEADAKRFSGVVLVAKDGRALVRRAYGMADWTRGMPNTPETAFMIYSNTKQFTAAAVLMLRDRGKLSLDDPIGKHLTDCPPEWGPVTIHHLLTHTSGIAIDNLWLWIYNHYPSHRERPALGPYERQALESPPGEKFRYSNGGYMLLAQVVTKASGKDYRRFFQEEIFAPLGMAHTGCDRDQPTPGRARGHDLTGPTPVISEQATHGIAGAGDVYSTADDLLKWDEALYGDRLLAPASREARFRVGFRTPRGGIGWFIRNGRDGTLSHFQHGGGGSGFTSVLIRWPKDHVYISVLANFAPEEEFRAADGYRERVEAWLTGPVPDR